MRVKVCGVTTAADAALVARLGADAVGVLVGLAHPSEDELDAEGARAVVAALPPFVAATLVTHRTEPEEVRRLCHAVHTPVVQLQARVSTDAVAALRAEFPALRIVACVHVEDEGALDDAKRIAPHVDGLLLDSRTATRLGGTGVPHDWSISRRVRDTLPETPVILAGGLTPRNVARAIADVRPYAVDVNSGVSVRRGQKSPELVEAFIRAAKGR